MGLDKLMNALTDSYDVSLNDIYERRYSLVVLGSMIHSVNLNRDGEKCIPDPLLDTGRKRRKALLECESRELKEVRLKIGKSTPIKPQYETLLSLLDIGLIPYVYLEFPKIHTKSDNVYKHRSVKKSIDYDYKKFGDVPRLLKVESAGTRTAEIHHQGIHFYPKWYAPDPLLFTRLPATRDAVMGVITYNMKPSAQRVERHVNMPAQPLMCPWELVYLETGLWFTQSLINRRNHKKSGGKGNGRNPTTRKVYTGVPEWFHLNQVESKTQDVLNTKNVETPVYIRTPTLKHRPLTPSYTGKSRIIFPHTPNILFRTLQTNEHPRPP